MNALARRAPTDAPHSGRDSANDSAGEACTAQPWYADEDEDGFGDEGDVVEACESPAGRVAEAGDCDDSETKVFPGASERCNERDDDCDGEVDPSTSVDARAWYGDRDDDGWGNVDLEVIACEAPAEHVANATDCDDGDANVHPAATELCDGSNTDEDCAGLADDAGATGKSPWFLDGDGDAFGRATTTDACDAPAGYVPVDGDCDDARADVNPVATEVCDAIDTDEDCDGLADDLDPTVTGTTIWYADADADGFGDASSATTQCDAPAGSVADALDCDDTLVAVNPDAVEVCDDAVDGDCDGAVDEFCDPRLEGDYLADGSATDADIVVAGTDAGMGASIVGAVNESTGGTRAGAVYVVLGPLSGVVSLSAADNKVTLLLPLLGVQVQFVPATLDGAMSNLWVMHVPMAVDCVDQQRSKFTLWKLEDRRPDRLGDYRYVDHLVVRSEQVPTGMKAFRLLRHATRMFIEQSIAQQMAAPPFTGVGLHEHEHS